MSDDKRYLVFNPNLCDGTPHCWFLKDGHCKGNVFEFRAENPINQRLIPNIDLCVGCMACERHCPAARIAIGEKQREECAAALKSLEAEMGVRIAGNEDNLFVEPSNNIELNIYGEHQELPGTKRVRESLDFVYDDIKVGIRKTFEKLNEKPKRLQIIELYAESACYISAVTYKKFYDSISGIIEQNICTCGIDRKIIYTHDDVNALKEFIKAFNLDERLINSAPLLILYLDGEVLASWGHGKIQNYNDHIENLQQEIEKQLRKYS